MPLNYTQPRQFHYGRNAFVGGGGVINPDYLTTMFAQQQQMSQNPLAPANDSSASPTPTTTPPNTTPTPATPTPAPAPAEPSLDELRTQFINQASQGFGTNYGRRLIGDDMLDGTIMSILGEQQGNAQQYLDRGRARGIYNDVGYGAGQNRINTSAEAARSQLSGLGTSVLDKYRGQANDVRDRAFGTISGLLPGQEFSLDPYFEEGNSIRSTAERNAGGDLRSALGGTNFFDFSGLTNAAGMAQGAQNLRDTDVATALAERRRRSSLGRGLGSQGAF